MKHHRQHKLAGCEVVHLDCPEFLVNSRREACRYTLARGGVLAPGYYLACWPVGSCLASYGPDLCFLGPHETATVVNFLRVSALSLGLIESSTPAPVIQAARVFSPAF